MEHGDPSFLLTFRVSSSWRLTPLLLLLIAGGCSTTHSRCMDPFSPYSPGGSVSIGSLGACATNGNFLLIRSLDEVVAIRFTEFADSTDGARDHGCARYEIFSSSRSAESLHSPATKTRRGTASTFGWVGPFHPISRDPGDNAIRVGSLKLLYFHPGCINLLAEVPASETSNPNVEFTVTTWKDIQDVDPTDPSLVWMKASLDNASQGLPRNNFMGYDLHITKAEDWIEASSHPIPPDDLKQLIESDPDLAVSSTDFYERRTEAGDTERIHAILWTAHPEAVPLWFQDGEITAKNPDDRTIVKMLEIAERLHARVLGDDGEVYELKSSPPGWESRQP